MTSICRKIPGRSSGWVTIFQILNGKIVLNASIQADAFRRDLTLNALYCSLEVFFDGVDSSAPEIPMWFSLLRTMREAFLSGNIMDTRE